MVRHRCFRLGTRRYRRYEWRWRARSHLSEPFHWRREHLVYDRTEWIDDRLRTHHLYSGPELAACDRCGPEWGWRTGPHFREQHYEPNQHLVHAGRWNELLVGADNCDGGIRLEAGRNR